MLSPLKRKIKVSKNIGFDIETYGDDNKFYMGSLFFDESDVFVFYNKKKFFDYILDNPDKFINSKIWAHNLGFDFLGMFWGTEHFKDFQVMQRGSDFIACKSYIRDNRFNFFTDKNNHDHIPILFCDTMNFYKGSLASIGKIINKPKMDRPDFIGEKPKNQDEDDYLKKYNINDSRVTKCFADFLQTSYNKLGAQIKYTIASTSMDLFKRKYLNGDYYIPDISILNEMYKCLYGGRTEILNRGYTTDRMKVYDFNSLYPSVMDNELYPDVNSIHKSKRFRIQDLYDYSGFCYAELEYNENIKIPFLQNRQPGKLLFPTGKMKGYYTFLDLKKAHELGYKINRMTNGFYFLKDCNFFGDFVKDLYNQRLKYKKENNPMQLPIKIAMNSLFGKFGQKIEQLEMRHISNITPDQYDIADKIGNTDYYRFLTKKTQKQINFIVPLISAYVTSYARIKLYDAIKDIQDNVFYMDTDSIFTTKTLNNSSKLGDLKLEYTSKESYMIKPKFYGLRTTDNKNIIKVKGNSGKFKSLEDFQDFLNQKEHKYIKFSKFKESLVQNLLPNSKREILKSYSVEDNKRDWLGQKLNLKDFQESNPLCMI